MLNHGLNHGFFISPFKPISCPIHWIVCVLAYSYLNFRAALMQPKTAASAQTLKSMSFIWTVWSTLYVYLCLPHLLIQKNQFRIFDKILTPKTIKENGQISKKIGSFLNIRTVHPVVEKSNLAAQKWKNDTLFVKLGWKCPSMSSEINLGMLPLGVHLRAYLLMIKQSIFVVLA